MAKKMKIKLNNKFYKREAIAKAIKVFKEICDCKIINDSFDVEIDSDELKIKDEFCNFVLGITKDGGLY